MRPEEYFSGETNVWNSRRIPQPAKHRWFNQLYIEFSPNANFQFDIGSQKFLLHWLTSCAKLGLNRRSVSTTKACVTTKSSTAPLADVTYDEYKCARLLSLVGFGSDVSLLTGLYMENKNFEMFTVMGCTKLTYRGSLETAKPVVPDTPCPGELIIFYFVPFLNRTERRRRLRDASIPFHLSIRPSKPN